MTSSEAVAIETTQSNSVILTNVTDEQIDLAVDGFIQMAEGSRSDTDRERGLFLTNPDLRKVRNFIRHANTIPFTRTEVLAYLGYSDGFVGGLEPNDFMKLFREIHTAVEVWNKAEILMKEAGATFITFHTELQSISQDIFAHSLMQTDHIYESQVGDVSALRTRLSEGEALADDELRKLPSLIELTGELLTSVEGHKRKATTVKNVLMAFRQSLNDHKSDIVRLRNRVAANESSEALLRLEENINALNQRIEELGRTYKTYTDYIWVGAWWGPLGLIVSHTIYSSKANSVKSDYNALIEEKKGLDAKLSNINKGIASLINLEADLETLELLTSEALNGAANIEQTWITIHQHIVDSVGRLKDTTTTTKLFIFKSRLSSMLQHWEAISKRANTLMIDLARYDQN